jgi:NADH-quinone oxidoreductase subunit E
MAWIAEDRRRRVEQAGGPYLTEELKKHLSERFFPRYPNKRAVLLPALQEIADFLEIAPAEVIDTATFYEEYWLRPKGTYLIQVCRSLSCEICDSQKLTAHCQRKLGIDLGETTADGRFTLVELECLGACGTAPAALVNDVLHEELTVEKLDKIIRELPADPHHYKDPEVTWEDGH